MSNPVMTPETVKARLLEMVELAKAEIPGFDYDLALQLVTAYDCTHKVINQDLHHAVAMYNHPYSLHREIHYALRRLYSISTLQLPDEHPFHTMKRTEWEKLKKKRMKFPKMRGTRWEKMGGVDEW